MKNFKKGNFSRVALKKCLRYNPRTGRWFWIRPDSRAPIAKKGMETALVNKKGNRLISVGGRQFQASRLAWFYMTGEWPEAYIDHKNNIHTDDRWTNLRKATHSFNRANSKTSNRTGYKGVYASRKRFMARCGKKYLGHFITAKLAHEAYMKEAAQRYGEFTRAR